MKGNDYDMNRKLFEKHKRNNRIRQTRLKEQRRFEKAINYEYGQGLGYYLKTKKYNTGYEICFLPERNVPKIELYGKVIVEGGYYPLTVTKRPVTFSVVDIPERVARLNIRKKSHKKHSNKIMRHSQDIPNYSGYKRYYDLAWELT